MFSVVSALARRAPETTTSRARRTTNFRIAQLPEFLVANNRWGYQPLVLLHPAMETEPCQDERFCSSCRELQPCFALSFASLARDGKQETVELWGPPTSASTAVEE